MKSLLVVLICLLFISCEGQSQNKNCSSENSIKKISELQEVQKKQNFIDSLTNHQHGISYTIDDEKIRNKEYYEIKAGYNGDLRWENYFIFYVNKNNCNEILVLDTITNKIIPINQWKNQKNAKSVLVKTIEFYNLFNEGTIIEFTPKDLDKPDIKVQEFKKTLVLYEQQHPLPEDFEIENLSYLINNETFFDSQYYTDSSWLQYFIKKYDIKVSKLTDLMHQAIKQEDYNTTKILIENHYIVSQKDLQISYEVEQESKSKILENKTDGYESYLISKSRIAEIVNFLKKCFLTNKINDPDGFTNLRKEKNAQSEIIQKIKSGEHIDVLDNSGDWFLIKTKEGKEGYVHKSRIKAN